ncbi:MAG: hypothetical protein ACKVIK_00020 [Rhodospirillales bacterium]
MIPSEDVDSPPQSAALPPTQTQSVAEIDSAVPNNQIKELTQTIISAFTGRLRSEIQNQGGDLTTASIEKLCIEFDRKQEALEIAFRQCFKEYARILRNGTFDHTRDAPFDRLIVNTFASLFDPVRINEDGEKAVTRHVLPGFFIALNKMISPEAMDGLQARSLIIFQRFDNGEEGELDWARVYNDPESHEVCLNALVMLGPHFENIKKRQEWFLPLVNSNIAINSGWELSESGFHNLINEMFSGLRESLTNAESRKKLETQFGGTTCAELDGIFDKIDHG